MDNPQLYEESSLASGASGASGLNSTTDFSLENLTYTNNVIQQVMLKYLNDTNFNGVTVSVTLSCPMTLSSDYVHFKGLN